MDARQFDGIVKALSSGANRRRVLGGLVGGLAAALGGQRATGADHKRDHCAKEGQKAQPKKPCCPGLVDNDGRCEPGPTSVCAAPALSCATEIRCSPTTSDFCECGTTIDGDPVCHRPSPCGALCTTNEACGPGASCVVVGPCCDVAAGATACMQHCPTGA